MRIFKYRSSAAKWLRRRSAASRSLALLQINVTTNSPVIASPSRSNPAPQLVGQLDCRASLAMTGIFIH